MADDSGTVYPIDQAIYDSHSPRVAACGIRYGHGLCTVLWIKTGDHGWVLLPTACLTLPSTSPSKSSSLCSTACATSCELSQPAGRCRG